MGSEIKKNNILSEILYGMRHAVYPQECPVCHKKVAYGLSLGAHPECYRKLKRVVSPMCMCCGKPLVSFRQEYCYDCLQHERTFEGGHGLWIYDGYSSGSVFAFKYEGKQSYARFYVRALLYFYGDWIRQIGPDQLVPVPLSREKLRSRGFNQAGLLAEGLGEELNIPVNTKGLVRVRDTAAQKTLGKDERRMNISGAFSGRAKEFEGVRKVLLIDDIYTTGSTVRACTKALKEAGVKKVWFLTLCIGSGV